MTNEELVEQIQDGVDVQNNLGLLYKSVVTDNKQVIYSFARPYLAYAEFDDLLQEAYFGLLEAVKSYVCMPDSHSFKYYAFGTIRWSFSAYFRKNGKMIKYPKDLPIKSYCHLMNQYKQENNAVPDDEYIMTALNITQEKLNRIKKYRGFSSARFSDIIPGTDNVTVEERLVSNENVEEAVFDAEEKKIIWDEVASLTSKESTILTERYRENKMVQDIANSLNLSAESVRVIERKALYYLRQQKKIQDIAESYGYNSSRAFHGSLKRYKESGISSTEQMAVERVMLSEKQNKLNLLMQKVVGIND